MPYSNIDSPKKYFVATTYTGNGSTQSITSLDFSPDFVWLKKRNDIGSHNLFDSIRGATKWLLSNSTDAEGTTASSLTSFDANGFSLGSNASTNSNTNTFISWSWRGSDSSAVSNTAGTITSTVSANTTSGFSIVSWNDTSSPSTIGHGLGVSPKMIIMKSRTSGSGNWLVYHASNTSQPETDYLLLNSTQATADLNTVWNDTAPTSTVFTYGTDGAISGDMIAYCFADVKGFSKFGSYTGNSSADGTFVYTGFKPAFVLRKNTASLSAWFLHDNKRDGYNLTKNWLSPDDSDAEETVSTLLSIDFLSNGFKMRSDNGNGNASGTTYIYMAFAENPFVSSKGIPTTAR
jgi:hypothetical protein